MHKDFPVNFRTLVLAAADQGIPADRIDEHTDFRPDSSLITSKRYTTLKGHKPFESGFLCFFCNSILEMLGSEGSFLFRVHKCAQSFELGLTHEIEQFLEFYTAFSRMADNHGSTQHNARDALSHLSDECSCPCPVHMPVHVVKHLVGDMLQRNVHIPADLWVVRHLVEHILREIGRIRIMDTYPLDSVDLRKLLEKLGKSPAVIKVDTVVRSILGYEH